MMVRKVEGENGMQNPQNKKKKKTRKGEIVYSIKYWSRAINTMKYFWIGQLF